DGYTFGAVAAPSLVAPFMLDSKPYDLTTDVQTVGMAYVTPLVVLVNPEKIPEVTDMASLVEYVKGQSGGFNYTTAGIGSTAHLAMEIIDSENDLDMLHIPYQGSAPAINALLAGDVDMMYSDLVALCRKSPRANLERLLLTLMSAWMTCLTFQPWSNKGSRQPKLFPGVVWCCPRMPLKRL